MEHNFNLDDVLSHPEGASEATIDRTASLADQQFKPAPVRDEGNSEFVDVQPALGCSDEKPSLTKASQPNNEIILIVRQYMEDHGLEVRFDGDFAQRDALQMAHSAADIDRILLQQEKDESALIDDVVMHARSQGNKVAVGMVQRAVRMIRREDQQKRLATIMGPLFVPLSPEEQVQAKEQWKRFVRTVFEMDTDLGVAILKKFVHSVKSKLTKQPVKRHLMPIFQSMIQGSGKTTAAMKFLVPLKELRTEPALLSDFVDKRSGDVFRYPVVFVDDMDGISPAHIPSLNSLVTGEGLLRRRMGGSGSRKIKQCSTLIGTCNKPISDLIPDETGNRRFANMPFRNGEPLKGGDPMVWEVVNETDFSLLWRSVNVRDNDPIEPYLLQLFEWQKTYRRVDLFEDWLENLDLNSDEVRAISDRNGTRARKLYELFRIQTQSAMSETKFGNEMRRMADLSRGPFGPKNRDEQGLVYPHRKQI
jgi:hypothetical protein